MVTYLELLLPHSQLKLLTAGTDMCASLPHHKPLNGCFAAGTGKICAAKNLQLIFVAAATIGHRIEIGLSGSKGRAEVLQTPFQYPRDGQAQGLDLRF